MRRRAAWLLLLPLLLGGCGDRSLILTVDVLSFLSPSDVSQSYTIPGGFSADTVDVASESVNLLPGVQDVTEVVSATLKVGASFDNQTGTAGSPLPAPLVVRVTSSISAAPFPVSNVTVTWSVISGNIFGRNTLRATCCVIVLPPAV